jgi:tRNA dimethylallyltransferase
MLGSTGVGKSQLGIDLARALNGQVINGDSMQVYRSADILTNKVTREEMGDIKHHLLGCIDPKYNYDSATFRRDATEKVKITGLLMKINEIHKEDNWPILVGGTHYYLNFLLFENMTMSTEEDWIKDHPVLSLPNEDLFVALESVDPETARRLHPSDRRKIQSRLELYLRTGKPASELFKEQLEPKIRWDTLIFWVWSNRTELSERLDKRVDKMVAAGVEEECRQLYEIAKETNAPLTQGIFQAIGNSVQER